jgi:hypothetical protein
MATRAVHRHDLASCRPVSAAAPSATHTSLYELRSFFANPLVYHLRRTLGVDNDESPATLSAIDEPLESGPLALSVLQKAVWTSVLRLVFPAVREGSVTDTTALAHAAALAAREEYARHVAAGGAPEAQWGDMERQGIAGWAQECLAQSLALHEQFPDHLLMENTDLSLGREGCAGELTVEFADGGVCTVGCRHALVLVPRHTDGQSWDVAILGFSREGNAKENPDLWMSGALQWLAERARTERAAVMLVQLTRGNGSTARCGWDSLPFTAELEPDRDLGLWLRDLLDEMLRGRCSDHLPFAAVQAVYDGDWGRVTAETVTAELAREHSAYRCYLEAFELADARVPQADDEEFGARARARFAPLLEGWLSHEQSA